MAVGTGDDNLLVTADGDVDLSSHVFLSVLVEVVR
jgi:hypothetical protein